MIFNRKLIITDPRDTQVIKLMFLCYQSDMYWVKWFKDNSEHNQQIVAIFVFFYARSYNKISYDLFLEVLEYEVIAAMMA